MDDDRRVMEIEKWNKLEKHMTAQTIHGEYTNKRLTAIEESLGGTNVLELRKTVSKHSTTINRGKGALALLTFLWTALVGWTISK